MPAQVGQKAPDFQGQALLPSGEFKEVKLSATTLGPGNPGLSVPLVLASRPPFISTSLKRTVVSESQPLNSSPKRWLKLWGSLESKGIPGFYF